MMNIVDSAGGREGRRFMREGEKVHCVACDRVLGYHGEDNSLFPSQ